VNKIANPRGIPYSIQGAEDTKEQVVLGSGRFSGVCPLHARRVSPFEDDGNESDSQIS
jgi:hypothetical protein